MSTDLVPVGRAEQHALTIQEVVGNADKIQEIMRTVMKRDLHYGVIPGTPKPGLWKPGAEKIAMTFRLSPAYTVEDLSSPPHYYRYRVTCRLTHGPTGTPVGESVREASTEEEKWKWREPYSEAEWDATPADMRRLKFSKKEPNGTRQISRDAADMAPTALAMAEKRAYIGAVRAATAASDIFEDPEAPPREGVRQPVRKPQPRPAASPRHAAQAPPPEREPGEDEFPLDDLYEQDNPPTVKPAAAGRLISDDLWEPVKAAWHQKGCISAKQIGRLFAVARSEAGWESNDVKREIEAGLGVEVEQIPWGDPYDKVIEIFQTVSP